ALALLIAAFVLDGVEVKGITSSLLVALVLAFLNATIGSYLEEITGFYKGILHFLVDAVVILLASALLKGFRVKGFLWAIILAVALTFLNTFLYQLIF
ncbi:MAG: phage holin family protein, partial [Bacteroidota bacterium]